MSREKDWSGIFKHQMEEIIEYYAETQKYLIYMCVMRVSRDVLRVKPLSRDAGYATTAAAAVCLTSCVRRISVRVYVYNIMKVNEAEMQIAQQDGAVFVD